MEKTKAQRAGEFRDNLVFENTETPEWERGYREGLFVGYVKGANEQEQITIKEMTGKNSMKPTYQQQQLCDFIIEQATWWKNSNDILSPTHHSDLESRIDNLVEDEGITQAQAKDLDNLLRNLLTMIRII